MRRVIGLVLACLLGAGVLVSAAPAPAAHASVPCGTLQVCTYWDKGYGGSMYYYTGPFNACITVGAPWRYNMSSVINNKDIPVKFYYQDNCHAGAIDQTCKAATEYPNNRIYFLGENPFGFGLNDHVYSMYIGFTPP